MHFCFAGGIIPVSSLLEQRMVIHIPTPTYMETVDRGFPLLLLFPYPSPLAVAATTIVEQAQRLLLYLGSAHCILQTPVSLQPLLLLGSRIAVVCLSWGV